MTPETHRQMASFIWDICNLLRGPYKRNEYRKVILPLTVLRRFDCILTPTKDAVLDAADRLDDKSENIANARLCNITGTQFYNTSKLTFSKLLDDPDQIAQNLNSYMMSFSRNVRQIMERFKFGEHIARMDEKNLLYEVVKAFAAVDLSPDRIDNMQMGYIFEELIRIGAEQANEEAGEHFTPREVIRLMVNLLLTPEDDLTTSHIVKTIYDPACGTGGMLSVAERYVRDMNAEAKPMLYGQDWNDEAFAVCKSDMLIKGQEAENIKLGDSFTEDGFPDQKFDYMLANPPFGVSWKQQRKDIEAEHRSLGFDGRFGAGTPRVNDGSLLFLQHMLSKMRRPDDGGSRIGIVFNGSPLFTGDAGSGESEIRKWIIENDWLEAVVALPDQLFYNTGINTYIWVLTNRKEPERQGKVQLIDARQFFVKMRKSLGNKRNRIGDGEDGTPEQIADITRIHGDFRHDETRTLSVDGEEQETIVSKVFDNEDFGFYKICIERPLRLNFQATPERIDRLEDETVFKNLAKSRKKNEARRQEEIAEGLEQQQAIRDILSELEPERVYKDRDEFWGELRRLADEAGVRLLKSQLNAIASALGEKDETAKICTDSKGRPEADTDLRDYENVPLKEDIDDYFEREVKPYVPDAWIDEDRTRVGYEIPLTRHFYRYEPPRPLEEIEADIKKLETEIVRMLGEVTG